MRTFLSLIALAVVLAGCRYDPPPEVTLVIPEDNSIVKGDPIRLEFTEPVRTRSLEVRVWPGNKSYYDVEGNLLPEYGPILEICTPVSSPCGADGGVKLFLDPDRKAATIELVAEEAFGPFGDPLRLEVTGALEDDKGNRRNVSTFFDFQVISERWNPYADAVEPNGDVTGEVTTEPLDVREGFHLFHAEFTEPLPLPQQFFSHVRINSDDGTFVWVMVDADPIPDAPGNTDDPTLLAPDFGEEGFLFAVRGGIYQDRDDPDELVFETEPFTLAQEIGVVYFELQDMVMHGRITVDTDEDRSRWDGTMAVSGVYMRVTSSGNETQFDPTQANFQVFELRPEELPEGLPKACDDDPCININGKCDLLTDVDWPPVAVCP